MANLKIEYVPIENIRLSDKNPRRNDQAVEAVVKSIEAFGFTNPILARKDGEIIAGHTRYKALKMLGETQAPVVYLDLNELDADVYRVADNKLVEIADWDFPMLADLFVEFDEKDVKLDLTGFSSEEIDYFVTGPTDVEPFDITDDDLTYSFIIKCKNKEELEGVQRIFGVTTAKVFLGTVIDVLKGFKQSEVRLGVPK